MDLSRHEAQRKRFKEAIPESASVCNHNNKMDELLESILRSSEGYALGECLERLMEKRGTDKDKTLFLEKWVEFGHRLMEASKGLARQRSTHHNSMVWPLTHDLNVKVFSLLGTRSLSFTAATCTMFYKSAMDPACYGDIDLTSMGCKISNMVVLKMIQRAGPCFRSLKLGVLPQVKRSPASLKFSGSKFNIFPKSSDGLDIACTYRNCNSDRRTSLLTRSCLDTLGLENGASGSLLKTLHLFNIDEMDTKALCKAISSCPSLSDLEIVGLHVQLKSILHSLSSHCHSLERLCCQSSKTGRVECVKTHTCSQFLKGCPNLSSLSLRGFKLSDQKVNVLLKGFCHLKFVDFSSAAYITGSFLRLLDTTLVHSGNESPLEVLILRDCMRLKEEEVDKFLFSLCARGCKYLQHLDISNKHGLAAEDWFERQTNPCMEGIARLKSERPQFHIVAEFPAEKSCSDSDSVLSSFDDSDDSEGLRISSPSSISLSEFSSDSTYSSDTSSDADENVNNEDLGY